MDITAREFLLIFLKIPEHETSMRSKNVAFKESERTLFPTHLQSTFQPTPHTTHNAATARLQIPSINHITCCSDETPPTAYYSSAATLRVTKWRADAKPFITRGAEIRAVLYVWLFHKDGYSSCPSFRAYATNNEYLFLTPWSSRS